MGNVLLDPGTVGLFCLAVFTTMYSSYRSSSRKSYSGSGGHVAEAQASEMKAAHAVAFVLVGSAGLLLLFYFLNVMSVFFTIMISFASIAALCFIFAPLVEKLIPRSWPPEITIKFVDTIPTSTLIVMPFALGFVLFYLFTRGLAWNWILNDILGMALCVQFVSLLKVPNLRVATILLVLIFFYDMFWVFFSKPIFGGNVMVNAASLELPLKLMMPLVLQSQAAFTMIGLGDIVLPSLLLSYALRFDVVKGTIATRGYWAVTVIGYVLGLVACYIALLLSKLPQPAMIYLVPGTIIPVLLLGWRRGEVRELWTGPRRSLLLDDDNAHDLLPPHPSDSQPKNELLPV